MKYYIDYGNDTYQYRNDSTGDESPMTSKEASEAMRPSIDPDDNTPMDLDVREYSYTGEAIDDAICVLTSGLYPDISKAVIRNASTQKEVFTIINHSL